MGLFIGAPKFRENQESKQNNKSSNKDYNTGHKYFRKMDLSGKCKRILLLW